MKLTNARGPCLDHAILWRWASFWASATIYFRIYVKLCIFYYYRVFISDCIFKMSSINLSLTTEDLVSVKS